MSGYRVDHMSHQIETTWDNPDGTPYTRVQAEQRARDIKGVAWWDAEEWPVDRRNNEQRERSMRTSCTGTHWCEPPRYPDSLDETWACQICGRLHYAFDVHADADEDDRWLQHVPEGTLGWTTRKAGETR